MFVFHGGSLAQQHHGERKVAVLRDVTEQTGGLQRVTSGLEDMPKNA
jgi:hypothetical protein